MKKNIKSVAFCLVLIGFASCGQKEAATDKTQRSPEDVSKVTETLKALVKQENDDFYKKDFALWSKYMAHTPDVYWICVEEDVTLRAEGWEDVAQFVGGWMKENPTPEADSLRKKDVYDNFHTVVSKDLAFMRYHKMIMQPDGKQKMTLEHRTFQWIDNMWKVVGMTSAPGHNSKNSTANVFIHTTAK